MLFSWLALAVVYWWPVGTLLFLWKRGWVSRLFIGYLISLPLYFFSLFLIYPAFGGHFHPCSPAVLGIYFLQSPVYFLFVTALFLLTRGGTTWEVCSRRHECARIPGSCRRARRWKHIS